MSACPPPVPPYKAQKFVAYSRVSRRTQADGHLSLDVQKSQMQTYAANSGAPILHFYTDVCTAYMSAHSRPGLRAALALCASSGASLLVARVDRLARSLDVVEFLLQDGIAVISITEGPVSSDDRLVPLLVSAEKYSRAISANSKASSSLRKAAGAQLGNMQNLEASRGRGTLTNQTRARAKQQSLVTQIRDHPELLKMTLGQRVAWLNERGVHNQRSLHTVPVPWTEGALRKPFKAALAQLGAEEDPAQS